MALVFNGSANTITGLAVGGLPDGIVDTDMLANLAVSTGKIANSAVTSAKSTGLGISSAQQFRLAASQAGTQTGGSVLTNWEESDTDYQGIGSVWSQSSGIFSTTTTGIYLCNWNFTAKGIDVQDAFDPNIEISTDSGSNYNRRSRSWTTGDGTSHYQCINNHFIFDVANASTFRLRYAESAGNSVADGTTIAGSTSESFTCISFIRLGDT